MCITRGAQLQASTNTNIVSISSTKSNFYFCNITSADYMSLSHAFSYFHFRKLHLDASTLSYITLPVFVHTYNTAI